MSNSDRNSKASLPIGRNLTSSLPPIVSARTARQSVEKDPAVSVGKNPVVEVGATPTVAQRFDDDDPVEVEDFRYKLRKAAGEIVLWLFCLAIVAGIIGLLSG